MVLEIIPKLWFSIFMARTAVPDGGGFEGTERFAIVRKLGSGGMGAVFESEDRVWSSRVALKTLIRFRPTDLYRFKKEFRALQYLRHRNLVTLYELISDHGQWFFTMELIEGQDFLTHVRGDILPGGLGSAARRAAGGSQPATEPDSACASSNAGSLQPSERTPPSTVTTALPSVVAAESDETLSSGDDPVGGLRSTRAAESNPTAEIDESNDPLTASYQAPEIRESERGAVSPAVSSAAGASCPTGGDGPACDLTRLLPVLGQLAEGLHYIHESGMLHRDLKPSNVLITPEGRVVILDFGLITEVKRSASAADLDSESRSDPGMSPAELEFALADTDHGLIVGTIGYMAPEQADGSPLTRAADWYSFGVMLYLALVGKLPFSGNTSDILKQKRTSEIIPPERLRPGIPDDLAALCVKLLRRSASERPTYPEIIALLGLGTVAPVSPAPVARARGDQPFLGRETELGQLREAYGDLLQGNSVVVQLHGSSGSGKSSLISRFLEYELNDRRAVVLEGRCFEQEFVPFKAVDSLIDSLSRYLFLQPDELVCRLIPDDIGSLCRMFPVLERVGPIAVESGTEALPPDPLELRRRAQGALRELLCRLGSISPLILTIDDLQWGDLDSAELLSELLRAPEPPRLLLIASCRSEHKGANPCLEALIAADRSASGGLSVRRIDLGPLAKDDAEQLAAVLLGESSAIGSGLVESIARESAGNPYLINELVRHVIAGSGIPAGALAERGEVNLREMVWSRIQRLQEGPMRLLELLAVAGQPLGQRVAYHASRLDVVDPSALAVLRNERLVRGTGPGIEDEIEVYHDQIRESVLERLPGQSRKEHHRRLAVELEAHGKSDPEAIAVHFAKGDQPLRAAPYYQHAAAEASKALAFDRAAKLYQRALELGEWPSDVASRLKGELGDALANSRRGREAGLVYLDAAPGATLAESIELRRRAFQQLLCSGDHDRGIEVLRGVFRDVGLRFPKTPAQALASTALAVLRLRVRGLGFRPQPIDAIEEDELQRLDVGWSAGMSLCLIDTVRAAEVAFQNLHRSLRAGEVLRATRALLAASGLFAARGRKGFRRSEQLLRFAEERIGNIDDPDLLAVYHMVRGLAAYCQGWWSDALRLNDQSVAVFRDRCKGVATSLEMAAFYSLRSLTWLGDFAELRRRRQALLKEAEERQDLFSMTNYRTEVMAFDLLAEDDPGRAAVEIDDAMSQWSRRGFHAQHLYALVAGVRVDLYSGRGLAARERLRDAWPAYRRSQLHLSCIARIIINLLRACSALASWADHSNRASLVRDVSAAADRLDRERIAYASSLATMLRGRLASLQGDPEHAIQHYRMAAEEFGALKMPLHEAAVLVRLSELVISGEAEELVRRADEWFASQPIRKPSDMIRMVLP
jgi:serine/threonine protein kinase